MSSDLLRRRAVRRAVAVVALLTFLASVGEVFEELELPSIDARLRVRGADAPPGDVVVVAADDVTLGELGLPWPLTLDVHARVLEQLTAAGAAVVVLDVPFALAGTPGAERLHAALEAAGPVTLATTQTTPDGVPVVLGGPGSLAVAGVRAGDARFDPDDDGTVRRFDHTLDDDDQEAPGVVPTLPLVAAAQRTGVELPRDVTGDEGATIDHPGPAGTVDTVSMLSVLRGDADPALLRDRVVVVGPTAPQLQDVLPTPFSERTSRAEIHAAAVATVLDDFPLRGLPRSGQLLVLLVVCGVPLLAARMRAGSGVVLVVGLAVVYAVVAQVATTLGTLLPLTAPLVGLTTSTLAIVGVNYAAEGRARRAVREVFGRYVPARVVRDAVDAGTGDGDLLRASTREATVLFSDLRGFTTFSEGRDPRAVMEVLNAYLGAMTDEILDEGGSVLAYLGDGIMAVFGAPDTVEGHADRALAAAVRVLRATERFNHEHAASLDGERFRTGVGLHSGSLTAGNLGTIRRLEYTVIGDTVNTASRIETMTKDAGVDLLVSAACHGRLRRAPGWLVDRGPVPVRGRSTSVHLWGLEPGVPVPDVP